MEFVYANWFALTALAVCLVILAFCVKKFLESGIMRIFEDYSFSGKSTVQVRLGVIKPLRLCPVGKSGRVFLDVLPRSEADRDQLAPRILDDLPEETVTALSLKVEQMLDDNKIGRIGTFDGREFILVQESKPRREQESAEPDSANLNSLDQPAELAA
jgi:hypothetical protein